MFYSQTKKCFCFPASDSDIDLQCLGSHLLVSASLSQYMTSLGQLGNDLGDLTLDPTCHAGANNRPAGYNFYHDSNVQEVMKCRPVIDGVRARVRELLREWPRHPTLIVVSA